MLASCSWSSLSSGKVEGGLSVARSPPPSTFVSLERVGVRPLRQEGSDLVDRTLDATGERGERCDGADRDHGQDDAVLGHRLALLLAKQRQEITKIGKCQHSIHPLSLVSGRANRPRRIRREVSR